VEFYEYEHELHDLALESNRIDFYSRLLEFFETQLSPQKESSEKVQKPTPSSSPDTRSSVPLGDLDSAMSQVLGWDGPC